MNGVLLYELHITVNKADAEGATRVAKELHWKTSQIDGDPALGAKPFFYLTTYAAKPAYESDSGERKARYVLEEGVQALREAGIFVIREKIELIVHDVRHA